MLIRIPYHIQLRNYQQELWNSFFVGKLKKLMVIWHRRAGKDDFCVNFLSAAAMLDVGNYLYLFPEYGQARKVIWDGITLDGMRFIDRIPRQIVASYHNTSMKITLVNGSTIQVGGSNNYNNLVGTNPKGIIFSEFALQNPTARLYFQPILDENGGWQILQSTPRGMNHCFKLWENIKYSESWYKALLTVDDTYRSDGTPVITQQMIQEKRDEGMPEELIQSEYYCDFRSAVLGSYYTLELKKCYQDKRIGKFEPDPLYPVYTCFDLGFDDATSIWFVQIINNQFYFIHYYENNKLASSHYFEYVQNWCKERGLKHAFNIVPHDIMNHDPDSGKTRLDRARRNYGEKFRVAPRMKIMEGIDLAREFFNLCHFDEIECSQGLICLTEYHQEYITEHGVYKAQPRHNWASHGADSFRYWFQFYRRTIQDEPTIFIRQNDYRLTESLTQQNIIHW